MAKIDKSNRPLGATSGAALAAMMLAVPGVTALAAAPAASADKAVPEPARSSAGVMKHSSDASAKTFIKLRDEYAVAGWGDGRVVFEDARGGLFYIDEATGDQKFVTRAFVEKMTKQSFIKTTNQSYIKTANPSYIKSANLKHRDMVRIVETDHAGRVIMSNSRGEKFYLDAATGDMIFVK